MCLLNGTVGGSITPLTHNFSQMDYVDKTTDSITTIDIPIKEIIYEAVHEYAQEPIEKIIINDLDDEALTLLEYRGAKDKPMWMFIGAEGDNTDIVVNSTINPNTQLYIHEENLGDTKTPITLAEFDANPKYHYNSLINISENSNQPTLVRKIARNGGLKYTIAKIEQGQTVGYRLTDITYPGELIESAGSPVTSVLDKIKNMLGNFEYFYDVDGNFIFQKKKTYVDTSWNTIVGTGNQMYVENAAYSTATEYSFEGNNLISAFSNNPQLSNIRNDYIIWGTKKSVTGNEIPVHLRYAIDKKPYYYKSLTVDANDAVAISREYKDKIPVGTQEGKVYYTKEYLDDENAVDWREIIYQMALDYRKYNHWSSFFVKVDENNRLDKEPLYLGGRTGYQQYYIDLEGF
jgi:hypothetical protein